MRVGLIEFVEPALFGHVAAAHHQHLIELAGLARPVQNPDQPAALEGLEQILGHLGLGCAVEGRRALGNNKHVGALEHRPGDGQFLALGGRQPRAADTNREVEPGLDHGIAQAELIDNLADQATDPAFGLGLAVEQLAEQKTSLSTVDIDVGGASELPFTSNFEQSEFESAVRRCVEYIQAGDIFQVVLSQRLEVEITSDPLEIYRSLRVVNPSPFMFFLRTPDTTLVGSSLEIMCRVVDGTVTLRPLAGTRPRGEDPQQDQLLADELLADPKERAEHVMLVDLGRNDVGRVARYGSVELSDVMVIERYSHVMHITSNVTGQLAEGRDAFDALVASLPAGTVSGAPKVRAMENIDELEPHRRGPYAGAVGYIDYVGNMDTCIALRTLVIQGNRAYIQAGAGIVADSLPDKEYQETLNKARGLLTAIELTEARKK